uniref:Zinc transporter n=1 Tax=Oryza punctata TaxID=4537 RepID=A0A0E0L3P8_ORYPU
MDTISTSPHWLFDHHHSPILGHRLKKMAFDLKLTTCLLLAVFSLAAAANCECQPSDEGHDAAKARTLKIIAIFCILVGSSAGCAIPSLGRRFPALHPDTNLFFALKAFAAGVILATAFVHILPVSFDKLGSPCLVDGPWQKYPFTGLVAMLAAVATLLVDTIATGYFQRVQDSRAAAVVVACAEADASSSHDHERGHAHGVSAVIASATMSNDATDCDTEDRAKLVRHRVISQVFELGIIVHSIIIGISLGASESPSTIRPLVAALTFHQFFEGIGLGGCIVQCRFQKDQQCQISIRHTTALRSRY